MKNNRLIDIFLDLVRIDGVYGQEKEVANYITEFLKKLGLSPYEDSAHKYSGGNTGNIICHIGSGGDRLLLSHMDTVQSTRDVKPIICNGIIKSDGTTILGVDNRAGVAVLLYIVEQVVSNKLSAQDFTVGFTICEESTMDGSRYLNVKDGITMGFVFDSSFPPGHFIHGTCGALSFTINVNGKASHSGLAPEKGINSIKVAATALSKIKTGKLNDHTILNIGFVQGGSAINVVPEKTVIRGEIRSMNPENAVNELDQMKAKFDKAVSTYGGHVNLDYKWDFKPFFINQNHPVYNLATSVISRLNLNPTPIVAWSGSDANNLNEKNIPSINFGIGARNPHSNEEYILIDDLYSAANIALKLITK